MMYRVCKYCGKETIGPVCPSCIREGNEILHNNKICEKLNNIYGTIGLTNAIAIIVSIVSFILVLTLNEQNLHSAIPKVVTCISSFGSVLLFSGLRRIFNFRINKEIDTEMKKRHKK